MSDSLATDRRFASHAEPLAVLLMGFERPEADALRVRLARQGCDVEVAVAPGGDAEQARQALAGHRLPTVAVVCLGERAGGEQARRLLAERALDDLQGAVPP